MSTTKAPPRTAASINLRLGEIGAELAKWRIVSAPNARQLEAEEAALKVELVAAYEREGQAAADAAVIRQRVEAARTSASEAEREKRIAAAVAEELGR
jgi:hypothetical protein